MPRPERMSRPERPQRLASGGANAFFQLQSDIKALNSSVLLIGQKMQYLVRNEKILGRNLIVLSKRLKELEASGFSSAGGQQVPIGLSSQLTEFSAKLDSHAKQLLELQTSVEELKEKTVSREEFSELKYVIDAINPMEYVTQKQLAEIGKTRKK
jgi:DNA-binding HxlR family transcriptional regulator